MVNTTDKSIRGVIPAILTPMDESGSVDYGLLEKQARYLSEAGVNGFFIGGTTAEELTFSIAKQTRGLAAGNLTRMSGCSATSIMTGPTARPRSILLILAFVSFGRNT